MGSFIFDIGDNINRRIQKTLIISTPIVIAAWIICNTATATLHVQA